jgi:hypothetical protein
MKIKMKNMENAFVLVDAGIAREARARLKATRGWV